MLSAMRGELRPKREKELKQQLKYAIMATVTY